MDQPFIQLDAAITDKCGRGLVLLEHARLLGVACMLFRVRGVCLFASFSVSACLCADLPVCSTVYFYLLLTVVNVVIIAHVFFLCMICYSQSEVHCYNE